MRLQKTILVLLFLFGLSNVSHAEASGWEYKFVPLGSLTTLQKKADAAAKMDEIEKTLNREGHEGWEMVSIFAVRTTFDPNVFFVAMKRPLPDTRVEESTTRGSGQP
ncbi:MAG: DUF4177 domain-containing protein [Synergistaceae bacterium]|jgi:hypothetical protein|nr:DUF4177 domain-containing protein [Synergistaceae bacterium]